jgi:hypothetical protein
MMARVLCLDPSGNFDEGKGTTGWALYVDGKLETFGHIASAQFSGQEFYWGNHAEMIHMLAPSVIVCESYRLQASKAQAQSWSALETPQLIGYLRMVAWNEGIAFVFQDPADKVRVADEQLVKLGVLEKKGRSYTCLGRPTLIHERDAIRHGVYFHRYGKGRQV